MLTVSDPAVQEIYNKSYGHQAIKLAIKFHREIYLAPSHECVL